MNIFEDVMQRIPETTQAVQNDRTIDDEDESSISSDSNSTNPSLNDQDFSSNEDHSTILNTTLTKNELKTTEDMFCLENFITRQTLPVTKKWQIYDAR